MMMMMMMMMKVVMILMMMVMVMMRFPRLVLLGLVIDLVSASALLLTTMQQFTINSTNYPSLVYCVGAHGKFWETLCKMAKRGRRRKRLYTPSRYKRTARAQSSKTATSVSSVQEAEEEPNDGEDIGNQEVSEELGTEVEDDEGSVVDSHEGGVASSSISCSELPVSTFKTFTQADVDAEGVGIATDEATASNKVLFMTPKRPLLSADHSSSVANKKLRMNVVNQPTAVEQILTTASVSSKVQHQHVQPQSSIAVVNNDVFMLNVSQTTIKNISPISSPPPLGQLFFQRTPGTSVEFPPTHGPVVSFSNEVVPTHFSDEREVQLHIEEDDAVNLTEQYSILDEIEAGDQGTNSISTETGQTLPVATGVNQTIVSSSPANFSSISTTSIPHSNVINIVHSSGSKPLLLTTPDSVAKQQVSVSNSSLLLKPLVQSVPVCETPVMINYSPSARAVQQGSLDQNMCGGRTNLVLTTPVLAQPSSSIISFSAAGALQQPLLNAPILVNSPIASQKVITVGASSIPSSSVVVGSNARAISNTVSSPTSANIPPSSDAYVISTQKLSNVTHQDIEFTGFTETENTQESHVPSSDPYVITTEIPVSMVSQNVQRSELTGSEYSGENHELTRRSSFVCDQKVDESVTPTGCDQLHVVGAPASVIRIDQAAQNYESDGASVTVPSQILSPPQLHQYSSDRRNENAFPLSHQPQSNEYVVSQNPTCVPSTVSWESNSNFIAEPAEIMNQSSCNNNKASEEMLQSGRSSSPIPLLSNGSDETKSENNASSNCVTVVGASYEGSDSRNDANGTPSDRSGLGLQDLVDQPKEEEYEEDIDVKSCGDDDDSDAQNLTADNERILSGDAQLKSVASLLNMLHEGSEHQQELLEQHHTDDTVDTFGESDYGKAGGVHSKSLRLLKMKLEEGENPEFDLGNLQRRRRIAFTPRQYKLLQYTCSQPSVHLLSTLSTPALNSQYTCSQPSVHLLSTLSTPALKAQNTCSPLSMLPFLNHSSIFLLQDATTAIQPVIVVISAISLSFALTLSTTFEHNNFPEPSEQRSISLQLGAPYRSIKMWFQNKRAAVRKRLGPDAPRAAGSPRTKYKNASDANSCFYCDLCPAAFIALPFLKRHKEYHQIRTFNCPDCNAAFTHPDLLMTHSRAKCRDLDKLGDPCSRFGSSEAKKLRAELRLKLNRSMTQTALDVGAGDMDAGTADTDDGSEIEVVDLCDGQESSISYQKSDKKSYPRPLNTTVLNVPRLQSLKFWSAAADDRASTDHGISFTSKEDAVPVEQALTDVNNRGLVSGLHNFGPESIDENIDGLKILAEQCLVHASNSESSSSMNQPINLHKPKADHIIDNETSQIDSEDLNIHSRKPAHNSVMEIPHNSFSDIPAESDHEEKNVLEGAKIQARVTMLPISAADGLGSESVPLFARSLPLIAALQQMSRANAEQSKEELATDVSSHDQTNDGKEQDSGGEGEQDFEKPQCSASPQVASEEGEASSSVCDSHRTLFVEQMNPDVRSQLLQQAFLNQIKQQQKHEQSQILHKLSKFYAGTSAAVTEQEREVSGRNFDCGGEIISSSPDLTIRRQEPSMTIKNEMNLDKDESNQLKFGNLTIYPIKSKTKTEAPQPIDLSSRSGSLDNEKDFANVDTSLKTNEDSMSEPRQQLLNTFHQNLLKILAGQSSSVGLPQPLSDGGGSSEQAANSLALLPFLAGSLGGLAPNAILQTLLNANILLNAATNANTSAESLTKTPGVEQDADTTSQVSQRAIKERIFSALLSQLINKKAGSADDKTSSNNTKLGMDSDCTGKQSVGGSVSTTAASSGGRPQRRRTTVFSESQHRILYQHFTHCNFPEPAMFRILAKLIGLDAAVIKIWFQNERSRQRKRASFIMEGNKSFADKPYKCMDCDMSFAMATFLVKHSARHSLHDQSQNKTRTCPICSLRFETDAYNEHLRSVHQVDMMLEEVKPLDEKEESENLTCYLCQKTFEDPEVLFIHKKDHLTSRYGSVASCSICDSSFVNAICLEAHMQTHYKLDWSYECSMCRSRFPEEILLKSHTMSHGIPAPAISSVNRYRSQTQEGQKKCGNSSSHVSLHPGVDLTASNSSDNSRSNPVDDGAKITVPDDIQRKSFMEALQIGSTRHDELSAVDNTSTSGLQVPIQISTSQVTTTQAGTPLAIRTTDAEGRSVIQLLPVQLIPAASISDNDDSFGNLFGSCGTNDNEFKVNLKPKTKKKIPDLIPISEYQSAAQKLKDQFSLGNKSISTSNEVVQSHADSILKSYITGALPRSSGAFGCSTVDSSNSRPKLQDGFEKPSPFPSLVEIESGHTSPVDSNIGSTGKDSHVIFSVQNVGGTGGSGLISFEGASQTSSLPSLTSPGSVRVVDSSHLTSQSSNNASFADEHSKLFSLLSQGLNLSKVTNGCQSNECGNSDDEMQDEMNVGRCTADSDATASDDELVIDLKEGNESQESENEDSKEVPFKIRESAATALEFGNGKLNAQVLRGLNLDSLNGNEEFKKYFLETIQKMMRFREEEMAGENDKEYEPLSPQNDDGCSVLEDGNIEYRDSTNVGREERKPEEHLESKKYRNRREYTQDEQLILLAHFQHNHFPPTRELKLLAKRLNITHRQIMHWFQNRRSKERKSLPYSRRVSRQCSECKATFVHDEGLASHKAVSHDPSSVAVQFGCPVKSCMMSFPSEVLLQTHELLHDRRDGTVRKGFPELDAMTVKKTRRILVRG
ncbi:Homeobox domain [Trinorchestia longiramus]|nr:Homeobox domain [Trinorchestia longiramus]